MALGVYQVGVCVGAIIMGERSLEWIAAPPAQVLLPTQGNVKGIQYTVHCHPVHVQSTIIISHTSLCTFMK